MNKKILGIVLIAMISVHSFGLFSICSLYTAYASTNTYSVENVIYFNATALGHEQTYCIRVSPYTEQEPVPWQKSSSISTKAVQPSGAFVPSQSTKQRFVTTGEFDSVDSVILEGVTLNLSIAQRAILSYYSNGTMLENLSEYNSYFTPKTLYYPAEETTMLFDSPLNYAQQFCDQNALILTNIINSTYDETFDIDNLNVFRSGLIKNAFFITEELPEYDDMAMFRELAQYGSDLRPFPVVGLIIAAAVAVIAAFFFYYLFDYLKEARRIDALLAAQETVAEYFYNATIEAINAEKEVQLALVGTKAQIESQILEAYFNGTISFEECQALIRQVGGDYSNILNNRTQNIQDILSDYYDHMETQFENFANGLGISTTWGSWLQYILILAGVLFAMYLVYAVINKKSRAPVSPYVTVVK